jgi:hypothetical protein
MYEVPRRNGGLTIREDDDNGDQIIVEPVVGAFNPVRGNLRCVCGASVEPWSVRTMEAGSAELCCPHCHRTLADITLTLKTHRR